MNDIKKEGEQQICYYTTQQIEFLTNILIRFKELAVKSLFDNIHDWVIRTKRV